MKTVALTGASGSMGSEALKQILELDNVRVKVLLRPKKSNKRLAKRLSKKYKDKLDIIMGDLSVYSDCEKFIDGADYVIHCGAIIPPKSDHQPNATYGSNFVGTKNLVDATLNSNRANEIKFVNIGTVALYGNRDYHHPWGRVGDPLMPSTYDVYAATKLRAERYVLEAGLPHFVSLRQTAVLHKNMFMNNIKDGLMFHTCWNAPLDWVTDVDSGLLCKNLVKFDMDGTLANDFWQRVYNIGSDDSGRCTGYDTFDDGFKLMGGSTKKFFQPNWNVIRNFHGMWFYDSDVLNNYLDYQKTNLNEYWANLGKRLWYFKLGAIVPPQLISKLVIQRLFTNSNAPLYWRKIRHLGRMEAFFGPKENFESLPKKWDDFPLFRDGKTPEGDIDYSKVKTKEWAKEHLLSHGYDESKPDSELDIEDMKQAAAFRGGKCLSQAMTKGDLYTKLEWECHDGHKFWATPYTVLKAGHWCPECCQPLPWHWGELSQHIPFFAQVYWDTHDKSETGTYPLSNNEDDFLSEE